MLVVPHPLIETNKYVVFDCKEDNNYTLCLAEKYVDTINYDYPEEDKCSDVAFDTNCDTTNVTMLRPYFGEVLAWDYDEELLLQLKEYDEQGYLNEYVEQLIQHWFGNE